MLDMQVMVRLLVLEAERLDYLHIKHYAARHGEGNLRLPAYADERRRKADLAACPYRGDTSGELVLRCEQPANLGATGAVGAAAVDLR